ncbi:MAG: aminoacyl-histidine dipeptidase [Candidatus Cryptobacteroides sp.]|nr:aminoacyl-histidine dipeptidase [Bacteroidales bacterium]MDD7133452.1 aminoacyl-histidine dipeptidase [Bacteroidales bacterium]MDY2774105.1 aminoacyl-histidine dipeptidase [Candidatus Cryptobacteroides sp.]
MNSEKILSIFKEITRIPRESGHEEKIVEYLVNFAKEHGLEYKTDDVNNVVITRPASKGYEDRSTIVLQGHTDMVCEKNAGVEHDFAKDPIRYVIEDGWMIAKDTTLGADCGIGVAAQLAALIDPAPCGKIECLFTSSEETGMDGAFGLKPGFITGKTLINLDSEDEGELFIGCAGGLDTTAVFSYIPESLPADAKCFSVRIFNGVGGHSGDDINKGRANAVQLLARFLNDCLSSADFKLSLCCIDGGNKRNAIARESSATVALTGDEAAFKSDWDSFSADVKGEYSVTEPDLSFALESVPAPAFTFDTDSAMRIVRGLYAAPHGVLSMSADIPGLVETSTNLASVKMLEGNKIRVGTSQRSSITSARRAAAAKVEASFLLAGAEVTHEGEYPGWKPTLDSEILRRSVASYKKLFGVEPAVKAIHAGLECGLFLEIYPDLDMISFGPTLRGVHAPGERLDLASLDKFTLLLDDILHN